MVEPETLKARPLQTAKRLQNQQHNLQKKVMKIPSTPSQAGTLLLMKEKLFLKLHSTLQKQKSQKALRFMQSGMYRLLQVSMLKFLMKT